MKIGADIIFVDFEAYCSNPLLLSEVGAIRVQSGKIVAYLHTFFKPEVPNSTSVYKQLTYIQKHVTGIPAPSKAEYKKCTPVFEGDLQNFGMDLLHFSLKSSEDLQKLNIGCIKIVEQFQANKFMFVAKGIDMEAKAISSLLNLVQGNHVLEFDDLFLLQFQKKPAYLNIHSNRTFNYCAFHTDLAQTKQGLHCALDDARYLAEYYCQEVNQKVEKVE